MTAAVIPPRVLLLGDSLDVGGTERQFVEVALGLDRKRFQVDVACVRTEGPLLEPLRAAGIEPWATGPSSLRSPRAVAAVLALAARLRRDRTVLVHAFGFYGSMVGVPAAKLAGALAIGSQRDLGNLRPTIDRHLRQLVLSRADVVVVNAPATAERLAAAKPRLRGEIELVPNGVDTERFRPAPPRDRGRPLEIGTVTNLRPEKGLPDLLHAIGRVVASGGDVRCTIHGEGELRPELEALALELGIADRIRLPGRSDRPEQALAGLDVFVLPSRSEASSNALLEAMATGLACIATRVGGTPTITRGDRDALLVPPADPQALAEALLALVGDPDRITDLGRRARARVESAYSMAGMIARTSAVYEERIATTGGSHR